MVLGRRPRRPPAGRAAAACLIRAAGADGYPPSVQKPRRAPLTAAPCASALAVAYGPCVLQVKPLWLSLEVVLALFLLTVGHSWLEYQE